MSRILDELISKRADAVKSMQAMVEQTGGKVMDADTAAKFKNVKAEIDNLNEQIGGMREVERIENEQKAFEDIKVSAKDEVGRFANFLRTGIPEGLKISNDVSTAAGSAGVLVPKELYGTIIKAQYDASAMVQLGAVIQMGTKTADLPVSATNSVSYMVAEGGKFTSSDISFNGVSLTAKKMGTLVLVSTEIMEDSEFDIATLVGQDTGMSQGRAMEDQFINGTASTGAAGVLPAATLGLTSSVTASFKYDDVAKLYTSVKRPYRVGGSFLASDAALTTIMLLQDGSGQYVFRPSYSEGEPDRLMGKRMLTSEYMPEMATGNKPLLFGDFSYYKIGRRRDMVTQRLNELYAGTGQIGFLTQQRFDGLLVLPEAIKVLALK